MFLEMGAIGIGILLSFFLKDINFLGLNFGVIGSGVIYPDFLLMFLIFFALFKGEFSGIWIGFFSGLLEDSGLIRFSDSSGDFVSIIGIHAAIYTLTGFSLGKLKKFIDRNHAIPQILLVFGTVFLVRMIIWLLMGILEEFNQAYSFSGPAIYTAILTPIWFTLLSWLYRISGEDDQ